jgi:hypothetical protein
MDSGHRVLFAVVTLALVLALASRSEAGDGVVVKDEASVLASAKEAIRSHKGGVFVVRIEGTDRLHRWAVWHIFTVEDVLKPFRNDDGAYFVPLTINERTPNDGKSRLQVGERYLIVTLLQWAAWSPLYVEKALRLDATGNARLLEEIRAEAKKHAVYGSSDYLLREQGGEREVLETSGVQTPHADGYVDPEPFGVTRKGVREAVEAGMDVLLVRFVDSRRARLISQEFLVEVLEDLAGRKVTRPLWVRRPEKNEEWFARSKKMPAPYKLPDVLPHRRYVIVVDPRADGLPAMKSIVPAIHDDGPTVRKIRSWVQGAKGGGKPAAKKGEATPRRGRTGGPAAADQLSRELLDSWMMRQYDLARAGVKEASCKVRATIGEPTGRTAKATGEYRWDGESGCLTWDNKQVARILARQGWSAEKLDMWFKADRRVVLDGTRLSAKKSGSGAVVHVEGGDLKEIRFDGDGVLTTVVSTVSGPGGPVESTLTFDYERVGDRYVWSGWSVELMVGGTKYVETNTIRTAKMSGFFVMTKLAARSTVGSPPNQMELRKALTFSDWKISGRAVAADGNARPGDRR